MPIRSPIWPILAATSTLFAQGEANTVTVSASRSATIYQPQVTFDISVTSPITENPDDLLAALSGAGISAANLVSVSEQPYAQPMGLVWTFTWTVPLSKVSASVALFGSLQKTLAEPPKSLLLTFSIQQTGASTTPVDCDFAGVLGDARVQARKFADAAGSPLGPITGITTSVTQPGSDCAMNVTFGLGYYGNPGPHAITVTATRNIPNPQGAQILISINVSSPLSYGIDEVTMALAKAGLANFSFEGVQSNTINTGRTQQQVLNWSLTQMAPFATLKQSLAALAAGQQALAASGVSMGQYFLSVLPSTQLQSDCPAPDLLSDARAQAQKIASVAGMSLGALLSITNTQALSPAVVFDYSVAGFANFNVSDVGCPLTAQFRLY